MAPLTPAVSAWGVGGGYRNYVNALNIYISRFDTMINDIDSTWTG